MTELEVLVPEQYPTRNEGECVVPQAAAPRTYVPL